jgi:hypothetical protein
MRYEIGFVDEKIEVIDGGAMQTELYDDQDHDLVLGASPRGYCKCLLVTSASLWYDSFVPWAVVIRAERLPSSSKLGKRHDLLPQHDLSWQQAHRFALATNTSSSSSVLSILRTL